MQRKGILETRIRIIKEDVKFLEENDLFGLTDSEIFEIFPEIFDPKWVGLRYFSWDGLYTDDDYKEIPLKKVLDMIGAEMMVKISDFEGKSHAIIQNNRQKKTYFVMNVEKGLRVDSQLPDGFKTVEFPG